MVASRLQSRFTKMLGLSTPISLAAMGGCTNPELASAVSNAGGLGMIGATGQGYDGVKRQIAKTRDLTDYAFGIGLICAYDITEEMRAICDDPPDVVSFFWGEAYREVALAKSVGIRTMVQVGSVEEAKRATDAGADILIAQGLDAGGHVRGQIGTLALLPQVIDACPNVPVLAAGGISDGRGLAAALCLGADGAWIGTRFLAAPEADIHDEYRAAIMNAQAGDTDISTLYDVGWPDAPGRILKTKMVDGWISDGRKLPGERSGEGDIVVKANGREYQRYEPFVVPRTATGEIDAAPFWAGQAVGLVRRIQPAAEIIKEITNDAIAALNGD